MKIRRNKVDIEWNNALFKALYSEDAFLCIQPMLSGYIMLATTLYWEQTQRAFSYLRRHDGKLGALNLLDYKVEPFLSNAIGIPCPMAERVCCR